MPEPSSYEANLKDSPKLVSLKLCLFEMEWDGNGMLCHAVGWEWDATGGLGSPHSVVVNTCIGVYRVSWDRMGSLRKEQKSLEQATTAVLWWWKTGIHTYLVRDGYVSLKIRKIPPKFHRRNREAALADRESITAQNSSTPNIKLALSLTVVVLLLLALSLFRCRKNMDTD